MNKITHIWGRITLEHTRQPGDDQKAPWYAYPLAAVVLAGFYVLVSTLDKTGF
ncbi:hypothetical protein [Allopusillimonas ginsengisoli]|uniref:hypothetical protein n=1 Tax=Allopusillimonas ginsengisoli TaxID=453575 RepID=UPI0014320DFA|nr:hypothetical protein [Allopusillimonas ginsengisoli]